MAYDPWPGTGALYHIDPDDSVRVILQNVTISNWLGWSPWRLSCWEANPGSSA